MQHPTLPTRRRPLRIHPGPPGRLQQLHRPTNQFLSQPKSPAPSPSAGLPGRNPSPHHLHPLHQIHTPGTEFLCLGRAIWCPRRTHEPLPYRSVLPKKTQSSCGVRDEGSQPTRLASIKNHDNPAISIFPRQFSIQATPLYIAPTSKFQKSPHKLHSCLSCYIGL